MALRTKELDTFHDASEAEGNNRVIDIVLAQRRSWAGKRGTLRHYSETTAFLGATNRGVGLLLTPMASHSIIPPEKHRVLSNLLLRRQKSREQMRFNAVG